MVWILSAEDVIIRLGSLNVRVVISHVVAVVLACTLLLSGASEEKRVAIYSIVANYSLPVEERNGQDYIGLLEILEPLGTVSAQSSGQRWKLRYNDVESEFIVGKTRARIAGRDFDLAANFLLENGHGLIPLASLSNLLPQILGGPVGYHENSRRLYIGNVGVHFTAQISSTAPPALVMNFTSPVNPRIATEPGKVQMLFTREPLVPPASTLTFDSKTIPSASYQESNGAAEIVVNTRAPLFASFSNNGRTITLSTAPEARPPEPAATSTPPNPSLPKESPTAAATPTSANAPAPTTTPTTSTTVFAVVDASHGGEEGGATLSDQIAEKDVTLAFARRLKQELDAKGLSTLILRDGDNLLTADQRASLANQKQPKIYISLHASTLGNGVRLYTAMVPRSPENNGPFLNWDSAQSSFVPLSQSVASGMQRELRSQRLPVRLLTAPLRPLNNIAAPAIAVEVMPPGAIPDGLNLPDYQGQVATGIAAAIVAMRPQLEAAK